MSKSLPPEDRTEYVDTWLDTATGSRKKNRKARALCPDGNYREVLVRSTDEFINCVSLPGMIEELMEDKDTEQMNLHEFRGNLKLALDNVVFEPYNPDLWIQRHYEVVRG